MSVRVTFPYQKEIVSPAPSDKVFSYLASVETSIPKNFPGVEAFKLVAPETYEWTFEKFGYKSYEFQIKLTTAIKKTAATLVELISVPKPGQGDLKCQWKIQDQGPSPSGTKVQFKAELVLDLPIPGLLKGLAEKIVRSEFTKIFDRFLRNISRALQTP